MQGRDRPIFEETIHLQGIKFIVDSSEFSIKRREFNLSQQGQLPRRGVFKPGNIRRCLLLQT